MKDIKENGNDIEIDVFGDNDDPMNGATDSSR